MPIVIIPPPYRGPTQGQAEVEVDAATVRESLEAVEARHPGFGPQIFRAPGKVHRFVKVFLNDELVDPAKLDLETDDGDRVEVVAAIAGG